MTQEEKRIKLSEASQGAIEFYEGCWYYWDSGTRRYPCKNNDPFEDLMAAHELEKILTPEQWVSYWSFLEPLTCLPNNTSILHAKASHRFEAIGQTLNLW